MTMPSSVWINNGYNQQTWLHSCNKNHTQRMIRADIAEELARALGDMVDNPEDTATYMNDAMQALARYNTAITH